MITEKIKLAKKIKSKVEQEEKRKEQEKIKTKQERIGKITKVCQQNSSGTYKLDIEGIKDIFSLGAPVTIDSSGRLKICEAGQEIFGTVLETTTDSVTIAMDRP